MVCLRHLDLHGCYFSEGYNYSNGTAKVSQDPVDWNFSDLNRWNSCVSTSCTICKSLHKRKVSFNLKSSKENGIWQLDKPFSWGRDEMHALHTCNCSRLQCNDWEYNIPFQSSSSLEYSCRNTV